MVALGRLLEHDDRSRGFQAQRATERHTVLWRHSGPVLDQGNVGSCTGNAMAQWLNTKPGHKPRTQYLSEQDALDLYSTATGLDAYPGAYPPDDTGSSGLAVAKAAKQHGYITMYSHAFGLDHALDALMLGPVLAGTVWTEQMFTPLNGYLEPTGAVAGGHEYLLIGANMRGQYVTMLNSWSDGWGHKGTARITFDALDHLLKQDGDITVPVV